MRAGDFADDEKCAGTGWRGAAGAAVAAAGLRFDTICDVMLAAVKDNIVIPRQSSRWLPQVTSCHYRSGAKGSSVSANRGIFPSSSRRRTSSTVTILGFPKSSLAF